MPHQHQNVVLVHANLVKVNHAILEHAHAIRVIHVHTHHHHHVHVPLLTLVVVVNHAIHVPTHHLDQTVRVPLQGVVVLVQVDVKSVAILQI